MAIPQTRNRRRGSAPSRVGGQRAALRRSTPTSIRKGWTGRAAMERPGPGQTEELTERLARRQKELEARRHITSDTPKVVGAALVIPLGLLVTRKGKTGQAPHPFSADAEARARIEQAAPDAVMDAEQTLGNRPWDVSKENLGWDITSRTPSHVPRLIGVKGRAAGATTVTITRNEILPGFNTPEQWMLARFARNIRRFCPKRASGKNGSSPSRRGVLSVGSRAPWTQPASTPSGTLERRSRDRRRR